MCLGGFREGSRCRIGGLGWVLSARPGWCGQLPCLVALVVSSQVPIARWSQRIHAELALNIY